MFLFFALPHMKEMKMFELKNNVIVIIFVASIKVSQTKLLIYLIMRSNIKVLCLL